MKRTGFFNIDKKIYAFLLFFSLITIDLLAAVLGFGGAQFFFHYSDRVVIDLFSSFESLLFSVSVICFNILIIIYSYRNNQSNKLKALGCANFIMSSIPFVFNAIYYPFVYLVIEAITDLTNMSDSFHFSEFRFFLAEFVSLPMCVFCFSLLYRLKKVHEVKTRNNISFIIITSITIVVFTLVCILALYICNTPISECFNYSVFEYLIK